MKQQLFYSILILFIFTAGPRPDEKGNMPGMTAAHNQVRAKYGVPEVIWSDQLAQFAQIWANYLAEKNQCRMKHRPRKGKYTQKYGENIYWASPVRWSSGKREIQKVTPADVTNSWADEVKDYSYKTNRCKSGEVCGHYTQVVWKNSKNIGCAMALCPDKGQIWVCNYDPPGNYVGQKPY